MNKKELFLRIKQIVCYKTYNCLLKKLPNKKNSPDDFVVKLRTACVKGFILSCGSKVNIQKNATISRRLKIGNYSGIGANCSIQRDVTIGNHVMMGPEVLIYTQNHSFDRTDIPMDAQGFREIKPVIIEDDVWLGARVIILPGVTIGTGSVIGAGAVVAKSIPPFSVAVGNPAKVIKSRLS